MLDGDGEAQYYRFPMENGQILYGSLQVPGPDSAVPDLVIIGPGITPSGDVPASLEVPAGSGALLVKGKPPGKPSYEPFSPQPIYEVARFNITVPLDGDYYIAVTGPGGTKYSLAPGFREEFTAAEWLLVPWSVISIRLWEGQAPAGVFAPVIIMVIVGMVLSVLYRKKQGLKPDLVELAHPAVRPPVPWGCFDDRAADTPYRPPHRIFVRSRADPPFHGRAAHPRYHCSPGGDTVTRTGSIPDERHPDGGYRDPWAFALGWAYYRTPARPCCQCDHPRSLCRKTRPCLTGAGISGTESNRQTKVQGEKEIVIRFSGQQCL